MELSVVEVASPVVITARAMLATRRPLAYVFIAIWGQKYPESLDKY